jgi:hypothetical protein
MKSFALLTSIPIIAQVLPGLTYTWPDATIDEIEDILYLQTGYSARNFSGPVTPCTKGVGPGSITAAEWIRIAFHDASVYNHTTQQGGLDASVMYELNFKNNDGAAFNHTFNAMEPFYTKRSSMSDLFAVATYTAVRACGGLAIPVRAGRIDATEGFYEDIGPVPMDTVETLTNKFATMGFSVSDMVKLVACGHTMGGVHGGDLPTVLYNNTIGNFETFDSSGSTFDNKIITEFLNNTSLNPLVIGPETTNSDKHVFEADGNVTVNALADPATFQLACQDVFTRMINTVNSNVTLSDVITPIEVKPNVLLELNSDGSINLSGTIRVHNNKAKSNKAQTHVVTLTYADSSMKLVKDTITTKHAGSAAGFDDTFEFYEFSHNLLGKGLHHFNVIVDGVTYTNGGSGYQVQDNVILQSKQSCISSTPAADGTYKLTVVAAVKDQADTSMKARDTMTMTMPSSGAVLAVLQKVPREAVRSAIAPALVMGEFNMTMKAGKYAPGSGYTLYTSTQTLPANQVPTIFHVMADNTTLDYIKSGILPACK